MRKNQSFFRVHRRTVGRLENIKFPENIGKKFPIFSRINALWRCADNIHPIGLERRSEIQRSLPAKLYYHSITAFLLIYLQHVL